MFTKWKILINDNYRFDENGNLWKLGYKDIKGKYRENRLIKMQYPNRWLIDGQYWSKTQLRPHLILDENPIKLTELENLPF